MQTRTSSALLEEHTLQKNSWKKLIIPMIEKMMSQRKMATANYEGLKRSLNGQQFRYASLER